LYGAKTDVLGSTIQQAALGDSPENKFVTRDNMLGFVDVACSDNRHAILASRRTVPFMVHVRPQGVRTRLQNQEEQVFGNGGLAVLPEVWKGVR
jgi:hypothetical protein